ncbi:Clan CA, family C1, cathepsin B-like cysteine peptidase [Trichomonas vaginalis G3]|uniref:Clan CA, family C1, cathepsin B-like cysteine peptidase n=1 Tax=Trichomonas vaginalis (strain ATCC PRA-98 / G3) TaxID=412133 RepID=A2E6N1_TRIV3|nr:cysteine-type peptidase protein [Trichomonas vaginalis G3]EAY11736.1 Clan CA, family C1, cathepsin B-like cysteine peptidase [Trichomonas vaginalis G3]KAI5497640.1 cysteine-type peptidase protein [Trichomonas vaginalis G3]|eukprot:XP_001323959.1 Clan CA, family C1, cathepsin B-like cysteine peptidase [Trichomonas vaginalis G3]
MFFLLFFGVKSRFAFVDESIRSFPEDISIDIPDEYNFLQEYPHCDLGPLTQECGCCYAYGPIKAMSHRICKAKNKKTFLSAQFIVACDLLESGCEGGCSRSVYYFLEQHGVTDEECHPWSNQLNYSSEFCSKCKDGSQATLYKAKIGSTKQITSVQEIKKEIYLHGPVSASVAVTDRLKYYTGGLFEDPPRDYIADRTHTVEIIGWGQEKGIPYWIILNQYGRLWGENGMMRIRMGRDDARVESYVLAAEPMITW